MGLFLDGDNVNKNYQSIRDDSKRSGERELLDEMWQVFKPFADKKFQRRIQNQFWQLAWELYLAYSLFKNGFELLPRPDGSPDICAQKDSQKIWLEATMPGLGEGADAVPEGELLKVGEFSEDNKKSNQKINRESRKAPEQKMILRYVNAISEKIKKIEVYRQKGIIGAGDRVIIAVNSNSFYGRYGFFPLGKYFAKCLFGVGDFHINFSMNTGEALESGWDARKIVKKNSGAEVNQAIFWDKENKLISAALYGAELDFEKPAYGEEFLLCHNPLAENSLGQNVFSFCDECFASEKSGSWSFGCTGYNPLSNRE